MRTHDDPNLGQGGIGATGVSPEWPGETLTPWPGPRSLRVSAMRSFALGLLVLSLLAQPRPAAAQIRGEDLTVSVVTFGPHEHPFFKFGHNAVLGEHSSGQGFVYNFGMFDFS